MIDDLDRRLIALLRDDSRTAAATLAAKLKVSRGTVQNRIAKLLASGAIQGFTVRTRPEMEARRVRAIMCIAIEGERSGAVVKALRGFPEVEKVHTTNGRWDLVAELDTETLAEFSRTLDQIRLIDGLLALAESERAVTAPVSVDLAEIAHGAVQTLSREAEERGVTVLVAADDVIVRGDPVLLERLTPMERAVFLLHEIDFIGGEAKGHVSLPKIDAAELAPKGGRSPIAGGRCTKNANISKSPENLQKNNEALTLAFKRTSPRSVRSSDIEGRVGPSARVPG